MLDKYSNELLNKNLKICGWVRHTRIHSSGNFAFLELNDGSTVKHMQIIIENSIEGFSELNDQMIGASIEIKGKLVKSAGKKQLV